MLILNNTTYEHAKEVALLHQNQGTPCLVWERLTAGGAVYYVTRDDTLNDAELWCEEGDKIVVTTRFWVRWPRIRKDRRRIREAA